MTPEEFLKVKSERDWDSMWNYVRYSVWSSMLDSMWDSIGDSVRNFVWYSVRDSINESIKEIH